MEQQDNQIKQNNENQVLQQKRLVYWDKMKEVRNLTFWLHVIIGSLIGVEIPLEKELEKLSFVSFIHPFFISVEALYCYYILSFAVTQPQSGCLEFILITIFNGVVTSSYINYTSEGRAKIALIVWSVSTGFLCLYTAEDTSQQVWNILVMTKDRILYIWRSIVATKDWIMQNQQQNQPNQQGGNQDPEEKYNAYLIYSEKMKEIRSLTFWLHVIAGSLIGVEFPLEKDLEKLHFLSFIKPFFIGIEFLYCYFIFSVAVTPPHSGCVEYLLIMIFNGVASHYYIHFVNKGRAKMALVLWSVSAGILLLYTLEHTSKQFWNILVKTGDRICYICGRICACWNWIVEHN